MKNFKSETEKLLSIIYPERCIACGCYLTESNRTTDFLLAPYFCSSCASSVVLSSEKLSCEDFSFSGCAIPYYYEGAIREAMLRLKFKSDVSPVKFFGAALEREIRCQFFNVKFDTFTCVPSTKDSMAERGYNQSQLIAKEVRTDAECDWNLLTKNKSTQMQHLLSASSRKKNIESAYSLSPGRNVRGKIILLVDDIFTTGSTCDACARTLLLSGASAVYVACVAKRQWLT